MQVILKKGPYFNYGDRFYVDFKYDNNEEAIKMRNNFEEGLILAYGANSSRAKEGKDYLMPYLVDENGNGTINKEGRIGRTNIPEDLLLEFIKRFVEYDKATVKIGTEEIKEEFDKEQFDEMVSKIGFEISVQRGPYFDYGNKIFATFKYSNQRQQEKVRKYFNEVLLPKYGANSEEATRGEEYMMPFLVDENGNVTTDENAQIVGGTSIPREKMKKAFFATMINDLDISDTTFLFEDKRISGDFNYSNWKKNPEEHEASKKWDICSSEFDELYRQDGVEKIPEWIEEGKKYIYPEKYRAWEDNVRDIDSISYRLAIPDIENTLRIMKLLEIGSNQAKEEAKDYLSHYEREYALWSILEFVKTGPEFVEENYPWELSDSTKEFIQQKKAENMILAEKYGQAQTSASQTNPKK